MAVPAEARIGIDASHIPEDDERGAAPETASAPESGMPRCPKCGWQNVRHSQRRSPLDFALSVFSLSPFRCRSCNNRFYRFYKHLRED